MRKLIFITAVTASLAAAPARAQVEAYAGQFMAIGTQGWCPEGWLPADGRILPINYQYQLLFFVLRNTYGGDGRTTFALPNLKDVKLGTEPVTWCVSERGYVPTRP